MLFFFFLGKLERKELVVGDFLGFTGSVQRKERLEPNFGNFVAIATKGVRKNIQGKISLTFCFCTLRKVIDQF